MKELGELEANRDMFEKRGVQIYVVSMESRDKAEATQRDFPHLHVLVDEDASLSHKLEMVHKGVAPDGSDADAPTTILVDGDGTVRWIFRPDYHVARLSAAQLLRAIDEHLPRPDVSISGS